MFIKTSIEFKKEVLLMEWHKLSFGKIALLRSNVAEIMVDEGVDIDVQMVNEIHNHLLSLFTHSFSLLINKSNAYSTQLDALILFGSLTAINKIAIFAPNKLAKLSADFSATIPSSTHLNIQVFTERNEAISWL